MGYYPNKVCCLLNVLTNLGYGMMNSMIGGQLLSKISGGTVSVAVGIIIVALASWVMATFGMHIFQYYERYGPRVLSLRGSLVLTQRFEFSADMLGFRS
jgi:purine-cytosine permease-like protein